MPRLTEHQIIEHDLQQASHKTEEANQYASRGDFRVAIYCLTDAIELLRSCIGQLLKGIK